mmetsp:Transcript_3730/g.4289  ORF Transcript_3730/g.4289 Transcript_3730/m.4289 type:complete len:109 (-) Transcript_3730:222-548(-)
MATNKFFAVFLLVLLCLHGATAIGKCREDQVCIQAPLRTGETCKCWSTCSPFSGGRKCDGSSPEWSGYNRTNTGGNDVGCAYYPGVSNARDLCLWYYDGEEMILTRLK